MRWNFELTVFKSTLYFKHEMIKKIRETSHKVELHINYVRMKRARPAKWSVKISEINMSHKNSHKRLKNIYIISINYHRIFTILYQISLISRMAKILSDYQWIVSSNPIRYLILLILNHSIILYFMVLMFDTFVSKFCTSHEKIQSSQILQYILSYNIFEQFHITIDGD